VSDPVPRAGRRALRGGGIAALLAAGLAAAVVLGTAVPATAQPGGDAWYRLRVCESGNNYRADTGNGYYGAYQFNAGTWHAYGGGGLPNNASPAEQDLRAKLLYQARGWSPWPACSRRLGLGADPSYGRTSTTVAVERPARHPAARSARSARPAPKQVRVKVRPHRTVPAWHPKKAKPVVAHRPSRLAVWSAPDGSRWGRPPALLTPAAARRLAAVRIPPAAFRHPPVWTGFSRPL
jgi:hypothetical protein